MPDSDALADLSSKPSTPSLALPPSTTIDDSNAAISPTPCFISVLSSSPKPSGPLAIKTPPSPSPVFAPRPVRVPTGTFYRAIQRPLVLLDESQAASRLNKSPSPSFARSDSPKRKRGDSNSSSSAGLSGLSALRIQSDASPANRASSTMGSGELALLLPRESTPENGASELLHTLYSPTSSRDILEELHKITRSSAFLSSTLSSIPDRSRSRPTSAAGRRSLNSPPYSIIRPKVARNTTPTEHNKRHFADGAARWSGSSSDSLRSPLRKQLAMPTCLNTSTDTRVSSGKPRV
ncbi:MAG: hypothetical protein M1829_006100 [Trizodia sp. TS-e1964]|nr:MAG: hypothetical protein M1829_006100 [Trizodia sp. TS-e1964]